MSTHSKVAAAAVHNHSDCRGVGILPLFCLFLVSQGGPLDFLVKLHVCWTWYFFGPVLSPSVHRWGRAVLTQFWCHGQALAANPGERALQLCDEPNQRGDREVRVL